MAGLFVDCMAHQDAVKFIFGEGFNSLCSINGITCYGLGDLILASEISGDYGAAMNANPYIDL